MLVALMTIEKFYETLTEVVDLDGKLGVQTALDAVSSTLTDLVGSPANPSYQAALASALSGLDVATQKMANRLNASLSGYISQINGEEYFEPSLYEKVRVAIAENAMTPSVAKEFVENLAKRRKIFLKTMVDILKGMAELGVTKARFEPGSSALAFGIPREIFKNDLEDFTTELEFINRLLKHLSEASTNEVPPVELEGLSSSTPTVALLAGLKVVDLLAGIINKFLDAWDKIAKMRKLREEAVSFGVGGPGIEEFDRVITEEVEEVIEESTQLALVGFDGTQDRRHELENGLKQDFHRLFGQIEVGLTVQFRAEKNPAAEEEEELAIKNITNISENIKFPTPARNPLLLPSASLLQGELHGVKVVKTTRTSRRVKTETAIDPKSKKT
jgi:hypothetical protein